MHGHMSLVQKSQQMFPKSKTKKKRKDSRNKNCTFFALFKILHNRRFSADPKKFNNPPIDVTEKKLRIRKKRTLRLGVILGVRKKRTFFPFCVFLDLGIDCFKTLCRTFANVEKVLFDVFRYFLRVERVS